MSSADVKIDREYLAKIGFDTLPAAEKDKLLVEYGRVPADIGAWPEFDRDLYMMRARWMVIARPEQIPPPGDWWICLWLCGRGFGKTRTASEDIGFFALETPNRRVGVIAPTFADVRDTCVEGESGILRFFGGPDGKYVDKWNRSMGELVLTNGSIIKGFAGEEPDRLRGPQFHRTWVDELAAIQPLDRQDETWSNIEMATRLKPNPQIIVTTTPRPTPLIRDLVKRSLPPMEQVDIELFGMNPTLGGPDVPAHARSLTTRSPFLDAVVSI